MDHRTDRIPRRSAVVSPAIFVSVNKISQQLVLFNDGISLFHWLK
jgi:hypothetical protein